jgi:hypothetical protein
MTAVSDVTPAAGTTVHGEQIARGFLIPRVAMLGCVIAVAALH